MTRIPDTWKSKAPYMPDETVWCLADRWRCVMSHLSDVFSADATERRFWIKA